MRADIADLLTQLKNLTYRTNDGYELNIINTCNFSKVELLIRQWFLDHHDTETGELKGRLHAYEQIIANSNFAPLLRTEEPDDEKRLYIKLFADLKPDEMAEKIYQICDTEKLPGVIENLLEYKELDE